jgi:cupin 2 domain-containing protein
MVALIQNIFAGISDRLDDERIDAIVSADDVRIERIVSTGQASPPGFWYDQDWTEWVMLLSGSAGLLFENEAEPRVLRPGDHVTIPVHARHRVEWTDATQSTVWLAVHYR